MVLISLYLMIGITIYLLTTIYSASSRNKGKYIKHAIIDWLVMYVFIYYIEYEGLVVQRLSAILLGNFWLFLIFIICTGSLHPMPLFKTMWNNIKFNDDYENRTKKVNKTNIIIASAILVISLLGWATIGVITEYNGRQTSNTIHVQKVESKTAPTLHRNETPVGIAPDAVFTQVDNSMDQVPDSNQFEDTYTISAQWYHNKPVYIIPIQFRKVWQKLSKKYIPGYFRINATNPNASPHFVHKRIKYSDTLLFNHNITRRMYNSHHDWVSLSGNPQLEIDNHGTPYYVSTLFKPTITNNRAKFNHLKVVIGNTSNGKVTTYNNPNHTPKFIDENLTSDVASNINNYYGAYPKGYGWINAHWNQYNVKNPTGEGPEDGVTTIFGRNHSISYFSDFTSTQHNTHSALGYSMINARTGHLKFYKANGIDATKAKDVAQLSNVIHTNGWHADIPVPYEVQGHTTWVMSILDKSNNQHGFFFVNNRNTNAYAYSSYSLNDCLDKYKQSLLNHGSHMHNTNANKKVHVSGKVDRVTINNGTIVFNLQGQRTIYIITASKYPSAQLMKSGDSISFETGSNGTSNTVTNFVNNTFDK